MMVLDPAILFSSARDKFVFQEGSLLNPKDLPPSAAAVGEMWTMMRLLETLLADEVDEAVLLGDDVYLTASGDRPSVLFVGKLLTRMVSIMQTI
jgi:hypothetical protein